MTDAVDAPRGRLRDALAVSTFRVLAASFTVAMLGTAVSSLAMTVLVYHETGSALLAAMSFSLLFLPYLLAGTTMSAVTDRWPPRRLLVACDLLSAGVLGLMALPVMPVAARLGLLTVVGLVSPLVAGTSSALVADALPPEAYVPGRAIMRMISQGAQVVGAAVGGVLLLALSPSGVLAVEAVGHLATALLVFVGLRHSARARRPGRSGDERPGRVVGDSLAGLRQVLALVPLRRALLLVWAAPFFAVAPEALAAPYAVQAGRPAAAVGWWYVALPLGTVLGDLAAVWWLSPATRRRLIHPLALVSLLLYLAVGATGSFAGAWVLLVLSGAATCYGLGLDQRVLDRTPEPLLSRMFTVQSTGLMVLQGIGFTLWGAFGDVWSARWVIGVAGALGSVAVLLNLAAERTPSA